MNILFSLYYDIESDNMVALKANAGINWSTIDRYPVNSEQKSGSQRPACSDKLVA